VLTCNAHVHCDHCNSHRSYALPRGGCHLLYAYLQPLTPNIGRSFCKFSEQVPSMGLSKVVRSLKYFSCDLGEKILLFLFCHKIILQLKCSKGGRRMWNVENGHKVHDHNYKLCNKVELCATMETTHKQGWANIKHWQRVQSHKSMKATAFFMVGRITSLWSTHLPYNKLGGARLIARVYC
jgi:hypothetical protein